MSADRRHSLAQEIRDALRSRGHFAPDDCAADLIPALGRALDSLIAEANHWHAVALAMREAARCESTVYTTAMLAAVEAAFREPNQPKED